MDDLFSSFHLWEVWWHDPLSLVVPLVEDNGCHKIKVAVLLHGVTPSPFSSVTSLILYDGHGLVEGCVSDVGLARYCLAWYSLGKVPSWRVKRAQ